MLFISQNPKTKQYLHLFLVKDFFNPALLGDESYQIAMVIFQSPDNFLHHKNLSI